MTERATEKIEEALKLAEDYLVERGIDQKGVVGRTIVLPAIREARRLASEEAKEKPTAPASLLEELNNLQGFPYSEQNGPTWVYDGHEVDRIVSRYRPTPQADILGELKAWCSVVKMPHKNDRDEAWYLSGYSDAKAKVSEIIRKFEGGVK